MMMKKNYSIYAEDFDNPNGVRERLEEVEKIFTEEDIKNAEAFGHAKGYSEGLNEGFIQGEMQAIRDRDMQLQSALQIINENLISILKGNEVYIEQLEKNSVELGLIVLKTILPNLIEKHFKLEMVTFLQNIIRKIIKTQNIDITINPEIYNILSDRLPQYFGEHAEKIVLHSNDNKAIAECDIYWNGGYAFSNIPENFDAIQHEILEAYQVEEKLLPTLDNCGV